MFLGFLFCYIIFLYKKKKRKKTSSFFAFLSLYFLTSPTFDVNDIGDIKPFHVVDAESLPTNWNVLPQEFIAISFETGVEPTTTLICAVPATIVDVSNVPEPLPLLGVDVDVNVVPEASNTLK